MNVAAGLDQGVESRLRRIAGAFSARGTICREWSRTVAGERA